jgi:hypothetical protein
MTAFTLIYFDLRVRTEGFDIALLTMDAASSAADAENLPVPASQAHEPFMTWPEIGSFAILTIGGFALYTLLVSIIFGGTLLLASLFG